MESSIIYQENALVIRIETPSPAALHEQMLTIIVAALEDSNDPETRRAASQVLRTLLPNERHLIRAFAMTDPL